MIDDFIATACRCHLARLALRHYPERPLKIGFDEVDVEVHRFCGDPDLDLTSILRSYNARKVRFSGDNLIGRLRESRNTACSRRRKPIMIGP